MKFSADTLRKFTTVHTWVGLVAGFALFVAFYAGAITVFHHDVQAWQSPYGIDRKAESLVDAQNLLNDTLRLHPEARTHVGMVFPGGDYPVASSYWVDAKGTWQYATLADPHGSPESTGTELPELVNALHYTLGLPITAGTWLMGVVSLLYGLALISGVVIHLPKLVEDLFALRRGRNLKRFWQDAHNVIGVLSLPMHVVFATTGALLCLLALLMATMNPLVFRGQLMTALPAAMDTAPQVASAQRAQAIAPLAFLHDRAIETARDHGVPDFTPAYLKLANAGDANAIIEISGSSERAVGAIGSVAMNAATGDVIATQLQGTRDANHATLSATYSLHFGDWGNTWVRWMYFLLGLGGAFLFYSGNLLWIESRRKRRQQAQGRAQWWMARATVGVCIGACVAVSAAFVAAAVLQMPALRGSVALDTGIRAACLVTWVSCMAWAALRPPIRGAQELLWLAAIVTALVPVAHGVATGAWLWTSAAVGDMPLFAIDAGALALSFGFARLALASRKRMHDGDANSVWALEATTP
jgi:uncharacterized iron-regulated membrane protein